jgi:hypothetical protein
VNYVRVLDKNQSNLLRRNINAHELAEATFNESGMAQQYGARLAKLFACACLLGGVGVDATYVQLRAIAAHFCCVEKCQRAAMPVITEGRDVNVLVQRLSSFVRWICRWFYQSTYYNNYSEAEKLLRQQIASDDMHCAAQQRRFSSAGH